MNNISTPWGLSDTIKQLAPGIIKVGTPSHGGIGLTKERYLQLPAKLAISDFCQRWIETMSGYFWFEEDCMASIPEYAFFDEIKPNTTKEKLLAEIERYSGNEKS